jgi:hypothetical protein
MHFGGRSSNFESGRFDKSFLQTEKTVFYKPKKRFSGSKKRFFESEHSDLDSVLFYIRLTTSLHAVRHKKNGSVRARGKAPWPTRAGLAIAPALHGGTDWDGVHWVRVEGGDGAARAHLTRPLLQGQALGESGAAG